jgi:hypothetical protein
MPAPQIATPSPRRWASFAGRPDLTLRWRIAVVSAAVEPGPVPVASAKLGVGCLGVVVHVAGATNRTHETDCISDLRGARAEINPGHENRGDTS